MCTELNSLCLGLFLGLLHPEFYHKADSALSSHLPQAQVNQAPLGRPADQALHAGPTELEILHTIPSSCLRLAQGCGSAEETSRAGAPGSRPLSPDSLGRGFPGPQASQGRAFDPRLKPSKVCYLLGGAFCPGLGTCVSRGKPSP